MTGLMLPELDPVFHQPIRTRLATLLRGKAQSFTELKTKLGVTDGNLDSHLKKLSGAGYLYSNMILEGRPHTAYCLSESGIVAFDEYMEAVSTTLKAARRQARYR